MRKTALRLLILFIPVLLVAQERVDLATINRIKNEAFNNSKVMDHVFYLTDVYGPRLAGSPEYRKAAEWCVKTLKGYGMEDAKLEKWGEFGRSWSYSRFSAHMLEPLAVPLIGLPLAWSPATNGPTAGEVVYIPVRGPDDVDKLKGKVKGKWVMVEPPRDLTLPLEPEAKRYTDAELAERAQAPDPGQPGFFGPRPPGQPARIPPQFREQMQMRQLRAKVATLVRDEGGLGLISSQRGEAGLIQHGPAGSRSDSKLPPVSVALTAEHYNRIARLLEKSIPVKLEIEVKSEFYEKQDGYNVVGDLFGGDAARTRSS